MFCSLFYSSSTVEITLRNRNTHEDAYKHHEYGDSIIVERKISSEGTGSYKIKNREGRSLGLSLFHLNCWSCNDRSFFREDLSRVYIIIIDTDCYFHFFHAIHQFRRTAVPNLNTSSFLYYFESLFF